MAIDHRALREAYFNPTPPGVFVDIPTREDYMAEAERRFVRLCIERGGDPEAEGLGEHGALIGGPGKPVRFIVGLSRPFERFARPRLAPLDWFERLSVRNGNGRCDPDHKEMHGLIVSYMAGVPAENRPSPGQLYETFHAKTPNDLERFWLHAVLSCISMLELRRLMQSEGLSIRTVVAALHACGVLRHDLCRWANQFADRPQPASI